MVAYKDGRRMCAECASVAVWKVVDARVWFDRVRHFFIRMGFPSLKEVWQQHSSKLTAAHAEAKLIRCTAPGTVQENSAVPVAPEQDERRVSSHVPHLRQGQHLGTHHDKHAKVSLTLITKAHWRWWCRRWCWWRSWCWSLR